jgi:hypothetical protein
VPSKKKKKKEEEDDDDDDDYNNGHKCDVFLLRVSYRPGSLGVRQQKEDPRNL